MNILPLNTNYEREVQAVIEFIVCVIGEQKAVYMSAPITSGKRLMELHKNNGNYLNQKHICNTKDITSQIVEDNRSYAKIVAQKITEKIDCIIINPTLVADIIGWTQDDYRFLWGKVIERYVKSVVFVDDWNYSNGCVYEFLVAKQSNIETFNEILNPLSLDEGMSLIKNAIEDLEQCLLPTKFLRSVISELSNFNH